MTTATQVRESIKVRNALAFLAQVAVLGFLTSFSANAQDAGNKLQEIQVQNLPGDKVELQLILSGKASEPLAFTIDQPARIALDLADTSLGLDSRRTDVGIGALDTVLAVEANGRTRVVLNLGGIANISVIDASGEVSGYDTGPSNCLMDGWIQQHRNEPFDCNGEWAASGEIVPALLQSMLADPYFMKTAPKSTGVEYFNASWLTRYLRKSDLKNEDVQATLAELTAVSVANSIRLFAPDDVLLCGGGTHNRHLVQRLQALLKGIPIRSTAELGLDPDCIEAILFAWLARERLAERPLDTRNITGASKPVLLGKISSPS
jgi:anhydro-N-acetylmuramic acid kinase